MAAAAVNAPVAQLCFGSGTTELNLREVRCCYLTISGLGCHGQPTTSAGLLSSVQVQKRVADLIRVIDKLLVEMQTQGSHWKGFLDKLAVINIAHHQVSSTWVGQQWHGGQAGMYPRQRR